MHNAEHIQVIADDAPQLELGFFFLILLGVLFGFIPFFHLTSPPFSDMWQAAMGLWGLFGGRFGSALHAVFHAIGSIFFAALDQKHRILLA